MLRQVYGVELIPRLKVNCHPPRMTFPTLLSTVVLRAEQCLHWYLCDILLSLQEEESACNCFFIIIFKKTPNHPTSVKKKKLSSQAFCLLVSLSAGWFLCTSGWDPEDIRWEVKRYTFNRIETSMRLCWNFKSFISLLYWYFIKSGNGWVIPKSKSWIVRGWNCYRRYRGNDNCPRF